MGTSTSDPAKVGEAKRLAATTPTAAAGRPVDADRACSTPALARTATHRAAVEGVATYLADEDADVYNITDAAMREDPVAAALNLTTLAAAAVTALANATGHTPYETLRSIDEAGFGEVSGQPRPAR